MNNKQRKQKRTPVLKEELAVTSVLSLTVSHSDKHHNSIAELGEITVYCNTNDESLTANITAHELHTGTPRTFVQFYGRNTPTDDCADIKFSVLIEILKSIKDEPIKTVAQLLLDDLTVRFADTIEKGE